ncbi:TPA: SDR family NAD(P)-dependent oxidoreductase [Legionella pneumophila]
MQLSDLSNRTVLITGASSGLGEQFSRTLSQAGAKVILAARSIDKLESFSNNQLNTPQIIE